MNEEFTYLGRVFDFNMDNDAHKTSLVEKCKRILEGIDRLPLHPKHKIQLYSKFLMSKTNWDLTISDINITWVKQTLNSISSSFVRKWLEIPINGTLDIVTLSKEKFGLNVIKVSTKYLQCQTTKRNCLKKSPNPDINYLHQATSQESIQVDQYKDTSDVTKSVRAKQIEKISNDLQYLEKIEKAFDTVDHQILLQGLRVYGLAGKEINWFQFYLDNRKQCCKVNGHVSKLDNINFGVPQGSCIGPLLLLIYINDLPLALDSSNVNMYADDTSIYYSSKSISSINNAVNKDLQSLKSWLDENKLSLNVAKTQSILIGSRYKIRAVEQPDNQKPFLHIGDEAISIITSTKYLGVQVDQFLNWDEHLVTITKKVSRGLGMLRYAKRYLPLVIVQAMYKSLVEPHFRYCCPVWGAAGITVLQKLQKLQNRAARIVTNSPYEAHSQPLIQKLGWPTIQELIESETGEVVYKALLNEAPDYLKGLFHRLSDTQSRMLRNSNTDLRIPLFKTSSGQKSFEFRGAPIWNNLSNEAKQASIFLAFKHKL